MIIIVVSVQRCYNDIGISNSNDYKLNSKICVRFNDGDNSNRVNSHLSYNNNGNFYNSDGNNYNNTNNNINNNISNDNNDQLGILCP